MKARPAPLTALRPARTVNPAQREMTSEGEHDQLAKVEGLAWSSGAVTAIPREGMGPDG